MKKQKISWIVLSIFMCFSFIGIAQNPIIRNQYSADPSARVFGDRVYVYPSHDILSTEGKGRKDWFCMEDYHVFSSDNLIDWTDHGMIVQQNKVPWVRPDSYSMWAPDCIERNGKYYFYFPSTPKDTITYGKGFTIGVAIADKPSGPFIPESNPIKGVKGIDPNVFIDKDGQAYLYWSSRDIFGAKLKANMLELDSEVKILGDLPSKGLKEGPYVFERNGIYYMTYPHVENKIERLEYAISDNPLGPFKVMGTIMDESPTGCWTNHHSIIEFKNQWYLFYHHNDYSPTFDKARSVRADFLTFNLDGTINKVIPTLRGIGVTSAVNEIQMDRYSNISEKGTSIAFVDAVDTFKGWKTVLSQSNAWIEYNTVDFGKKRLKSVTVKALSSTGGILQIRTNGINGTVIAEVKIPVSTTWQDIKVPVKKFESGIQNVSVQLTDNNKQVEVDWISFE
ncbi:family 43 glycosylhydrolase [Flavobacterium franklandianum]|uniref:Family 43 glycosylhydrolase n=1 Tax=Flavobacterium franklandianum TaxID=2594430 RepID=A0A553CPA8_9FLAO|nr:family 43 glycosylhydrolase [Flavobacterium franklandianum]TRX22297.1 family 43 glycosylhydrolase [Flavobacterium franklandianum]TRX28854.1 family 43 glycosylhydrolase [Flavobacterium franklandianum]